MHCRGMKLFFALKAHKPVLVAHVSLRTVTVELIAPFHLAGPKGTENRHRVSGCRLTAADWVERRGYLIRQSVPVMGRLELCDRRVS
jgi:hypothetical protein